MVDAGCRHEATSIRRLFIINFNINIILCQVNIQVNAKGITFLEGFLKVDQLKLNQVVHYNRSYTLAILGLFIHNQLLIDILLFLRLISRDRNKLAHKLTALSLNVNIILYGESRNSAYAEYEKYIAHQFTHTMNTEVEMKFSSLYKL